MSPLHLGHFGTRTGRRLITSPWRITCRGNTQGPAPGDRDPVAALLQLGVDRHYVAPGQTHSELLRRGMSCSYGPLGRELRSNLLEQWWSSVTRSRTTVFGISTLHACGGGGGGGSSAKQGAGFRRVVDVERIVGERDLEQLSKEQLVHKLQLLLGEPTALRTNFLQGALEQYIPSLELVNRRLPFGLAETGQCFQPSDGAGCLDEATQTSLVWFCSPRTSSQWLDHWTRQRLRWWRKFALRPSHFSSSDVPEKELWGPVSRGVNILYSFPWGQEALETLCSRGDTELLQAHKGVRAKLQCRDGRKLVVPHVISVTGNVDRGMMAYMYNSLQQLTKEDNKQRLFHRKVLKLHPVLAPIKVALDMGRGATVELRQVCEGLLQEFLAVGISAWPGYVETTPSSIEQLNNKYDEMGVLFTVVVSDNTLESGLLQVRSRDTTIREVMHISEVKHFLARYISAAKDT